MINYKRRQSIAKWILGITMVVCLFSILGLCGGLEQNMVSITQVVIVSGVLLIPTYIAYKGLQLLGIFEK